MATVKVQAKRPGGGISNFNEEGYPIVDEKITVTMMGMRHPIQGEWENMDFFKTMEEMTNIAFEFDNPASDVFEERKTLAITGDTYPEVFFGANLSTDQQVEWGSEGYLIPLNDLIEKYAPNIQKMFEEIPETKAAVTAPDGNIYSIPQINASPIAYLSGGYWNGAWLEALGVTSDQLPTTRDEFTDLLRRFRDEDPNGNGQADEIPLMLTVQTTVGGDIPDQYILPTFGVNATMQYVDSDGTVKFGVQQDAYKDYMTYMNMLYEEKLLDNNYVTGDSVTTTAQSMANNVGIVLTAIPQNSYPVSAEEAVNYPMMQALSGDETNGEPVYAYGNNNGIVTGAFAITDKCENPEAMIRWVDYLYSEEGSIFIHYGEEGDLWEYTDEGLRQYIDHEGMSTEEYRGTITPDVGTVTPKWVREETEGSWDDPFQPTRIANTEEYLLPYAVQTFPQTFFSAEDTERRTEIITDLSKYVEEMIAGFITGTHDIEGEWDEFQQTLLDMNIEELTQIYQESYDTWAAANE